MNINTDEPLDFTMDPDEELDNVPDNELDEDLDNVPDTQTPKIDETVCRPIEMPKHNARPRQPRKHYNNRNNVLDLGLGRTMKFNNPQTNDIELISALHVVIDNLLYKNNRRGYRPNHNNNNNRNRSRSGPDDLYSNSRHDSRNDSRHGNRNDSRNNSYGGNNRGNVHGNISSNIRSNDNYNSREQRGDREQRSGHNQYDGRSQYDNNARPNAVVHPQQNNSSYGNGSGTSYYSNGNSNGNSNNDMSGINDRITSPNNVQLNKPQPLTSSGHNQILSNPQIPSIQEHVPPAKVPKPRGKRSKVAPPQPLNNAPNNGLPNNGFYPQTFAPNQYLEKPGQNDQYYHT